MNFSSKIKLIFSFLITLQLASFSYAENLEYPKMKAGLWESTLPKIEGMDIKSSKMCLDDESSKMLIESSKKMTQGMCSKVMMKKISETKYISDMECKTGPISIKVKTVAEGDFNKKYTTVITTETTPDIGGQGKKIDTSTSTYLGACPAGMKPGDVDMGDGQTVNVNDQMKNMPNMEEMKQMNAEMGKAMENASKGMEEMNELMKNMPKEIQDQMKEANKQMQKTLGK